ncbi:MAG TPA: hypothetical protein VG276_26435 [Actinomycetes bacterium]|jgi:hypothetical protein|nr:hypothetical protein [Actinomycetes bacterium]
MAVTAATAATVRAREGNRCQLCTLGEYEEGRGRLVLHHKQAKSAGGTADPTRDLPGNLVLLHDRQCHPWVHAHPREARALGLLASRLGTVRPSALIQRGPA